MALSTYLAEYIRISNIHDKLSLRDRLFVYSADLVLLHMNKNTPIDEFNLMIENKKLQKKITGTFMCDFKIGEEKKMIEIANTYNGLWETKLDGIDDPEDNEIYAVFSNPKDAYAFMQNAIVRS